MSNILTFGDKTGVSALEQYPEFNYEIRYSAEGRPSEVVQGFLTVMGGIFFIGSGTKPDHERQIPSEVNWVWSAPESQIQSIISQGPAVTRRLDA